MNETFLFDTYALIEIIRGNPNYSEYTKSKAITTIFNISELNYILKKEHPKVHTILLSKEYVTLDAGTGLVHCAPGCGPEDFEVGNYTDLEKIKSYALKIKPDFAFIGPEEPLSNGVVNLLNEIGINTIGPTKNLARLETSKSFTRNLLKKYKINGNPKFEIFNKNNMNDANVITLVSKKGRSSQMNAGASIAKGQILLFVHADTSIPKDALNIIFGDAQFVDNHSVTIGYSFERM